MSGAQGLLGRRAFLARAGAVALAGTCGSLPLAGCAGYRYAAGSLRGSMLEVPVSGMGEDPGVLVTHPTLARPVYLHRTGPDRYAALLTRCTHLGCQVEPRGPRLVCPCHGSEFGLDGTVMEGPADRPLTSYPVRREGDVLLVDLAAARVP